MDAFAGSQLRVFGQLLREMAARLPGDRNLPAWIQTRLAGDKRFGSRDRRAYRELLYTAVRYWPWLRELEGTSEDAVGHAVVRLASPLPALARLKSAVEGPSLHDHSIAEKAAALGVTASLLPDWVQAECPQAAVPPDLELLHRRAPLWLRLQTGDRAAVLNEFAGLGWVWSEHPLFPDALRVEGDVDVTRTEAFTRGWVEVQDLGSQWVLHLAGPQPGERWLDACAGAGGKTLQLARMLGASGEVQAHDVRADALAELSSRAKRARLTQITPVAKPRGSFDGVLVDAPCTGSGTWRRAPHLKGCTRPSDVQAAARVQLRVLADMSAFVRPGGLLVYATCSLARLENEGVIERFLVDAPEFVAEPLPEPLGGSVTGLGATLWPSVHDTDGFFAARLRRHG